ncbi:MAG: hypothetical protein NVSMB57_10670 [Actinomycetota bacterium]
MRKIAVFVLLVQALLLPARIGAAPNPVADAVTELLQRRSQAVTTFDSPAFEQTMAGAPQQYLERQRAWLRRLRALPLQRYDLVLRDDELGDLARPADRTGYDEVRVLQVKERIALTGYDKNPTDEDLFLTIARRGGTWSVVGDEAVEDLGLRSNRNLWDFGDVETSESDHILAVFHPSERNAVSTILTQAKAARARVGKAWPFGFTQPIVIMVPSTVEELARVLQTTFDLTNFVAFAASSVERDNGYRLVGHRVFLHWPNFRKYNGTFQTQILSHEFTHLATRDVAGPYISAIMDEGIAQHYGEAGGHTRGEVAKRLHAHSLNASLVPNWYFTAGPAEDIRLAYDEASSFIGFLTKRFGEDAGARAYKALGTIDPVSPGTRRYHLDNVFRTLFHQSYASLEHDWFATVRKENS